MPRPRTPAGGSPRSTTSTSDGPSDGFSRSADELRFERDRHRGERARNRTSLLRAFGELEEPRLVDTGHLALEDEDDRPRDPVDALLLHRERRADAELLGRMTIRRQREAQRHREASRV